MDKMLHLPNMHPINYVGRYCYPTFSGFHNPTALKRKIKAYRERISPNGESVAQVRVRFFFWHEWVAVSSIDFIWNVMDGRNDDSRNAKHNFSFDPKEK
jgi:hypothetical protein